LAEVGARLDSGNAIGVCDKVPMVVPDIPIIHRLVTKNFAFATRLRRAWSLGDRDGGPGLPWNRQRQQGAAGG
jgi:hypothetical protein